MAAAGLVCLATSQAADAATAGRLLQEGGTLARSCYKLQGGTPAATLRGNYEACHRAVTAIVKAIELAGRDTATIRRMSPILANATIKMGATALQLGRLYLARNDPKSAAGFLHAACAATEVPFLEEGPDPHGLLMSIGTEAESLLPDDHKSCAGDALPR